MLVEFVTCIADLINNTVIGIVPEARFTAVKLTEPQTIQFRQIGKIIKKRYRCWVFCWQSRHYSICGANFLNFCRAHSCMFPMLIAALLGSSNRSMVVMLRSARAPKNRMTRKTPVVTRPMRIGMVKNPTQS